MAGDAWELITSGEEQTRRVGFLLGELLRPGDVVALHGPLGAGKTRLVQGIAAGMGVSRPVTSPTFILMNFYPAQDGRVLCHIDCYRLADPVEEAYQLGWDQELGDEAVCVVEWAERIASLLPADHLAVHIEMLDDDRRRLRFQGGGPRSEALLRALRERAEQEPSLVHREALHSCG